MTALYNGETPAQFTARLNEKYKVALDQIEQCGLTPIQQTFDTLLCKIYNLGPITQSKSTLHNLNLQINKFIQSQEV